MFTSPFRLLRTVFSRISRSRFSYTPLITITISKSALLHNLAELRKINPLVAPVLKSNAYGHGLIEIASILDSQGCPFLIVDSYFEAIILRRYGTNSPLLIIGYTPIGTICNNKLKNISFTVTSLDALRELSAARCSATIHIKIDTGMNRQGIRIDEVDQAVQFIKSSEAISNHITIEGILTHLSDADNDDPTFTLKQISLWNEIIKKFPPLRFIHIANSAGHAYIYQAAASTTSVSNVSRSGIALYGINEHAPIDKLVNLRPVLEMKTIISDVKKIKKGEEVGYGKSFIAPRDMTIATIPVGYFEGVDRRLSNTEKIVGRVSMNITTIDAGGYAENANLRRGDVFTIISKNPVDWNSVESMARKCETIPYEILVHIPGHLKRVVVD